MDSKASAPPPGLYPATNMPEAPPSYEASMGQPNYGPPPGAGAMPPGGFVAPVPAPAPKGGLPPPPPGPMNTGQPVIVQYVNAPNFGPHPVQMVCPHCQCQVQTSTDSEPGPMAWILAGVLCIVGLWPCACIPCCIDSLNSVTHKCPNCKNFLGRYKGGL